jgi:GH15 family glucan-1,4-alpha-glucosidase
MSEADNTATVLVAKRDEQARVSQAESDNIHAFGRIPRVGIKPVAPSELPLAIEDYALIGDCTTAALVGRNGSIDWLCWPRFDSSACFAALLGTSEHRRWRICPVDPAPRDGTMVLETIFDTADGCVALIDFMPIGGPNSSVVRLVEGRRGNVAMRLHLTLRFDYGATIPWVTQLGDDSGLSAVAGSSQAVLRTPIA